MPTAKTKNKYNHNHIHSGNYRGSERWKPTACRMCCARLSADSRYSLGYLGLDSRVIFPVSGFTSLVMPPAPRDRTLCSSSIMMML